MRRRTEKVLVRRRTGSGLRRAQDEVVVEEPLSIQLDGVLVTTTMRTPGHDFELAAGFCFTEGLLGDAAVQRCRYCGEGGSGALTDFNVVTVDTGGAAPPPTPRLGPTTAACGVCGAESVAELAGRLVPLPPVPALDLDVAAAMAERVRRAQVLFGRTGGVHAAAAFEADGSLAVVREDIGRHNAVDKVIGRLLLDGVLPAVGRGLFVSGRASFEMAQKAWAGGFTALVAVGAPSSLAVDVARAAGMCLVGFARGDSLNVYTP